jgi:hypothetical protein
MQDVMSDAHGRLGPDPSADRLADATHIARDDVPLSRRDALRRFAIAAAVASSGALLTACASSATGRRSAAAAPSDRRTSELLRKYSRPSRAQVHATPRERFDLDDAQTADPWSPGDTPTGVIPRSRWAKAAPIPANMNRMLPIGRITFHHDGMNVFRDTSESAAAERLELIRRAHVNRRPAFGDIGYHYIIDPAGRVWQGRPLTWQGAHVGGQNEHNLGICLLGNYEQQQPNAAQERTIRRFLVSQMHQHRVTQHRVFTHRELAATACPGRLLQPRLAAARSAAARVRI